MLPLSAWYSVSLASQLPTLWYVLNTMAWFVSVLKSLWLHFQSEMHERDLLIAFVKWKIQCFDKLVHEYTSVSGFMSNWGQIWFDLKASSSNQWLSASSSLYMQLVCELLLVDFFPFFKKDLLAHLMVFNALINFINCPFLITVFILAIFLYLLATICQSCIRTQIDYDVTYIDLRYGIWLLTCLVHVDILDFLVWRFEVTDFIYNWVS